MNHSNHCRPVRFVARIALLVWMSILMGCSSNSKTWPASIVGTWELTTPTDLAQKVNQEEEADDKEVDIRTKLLLIFRGNGELESVTRLGQINQQKKGTWKAIPQTGNPNRLSIECVLNAQTTVHEVEFLDGQQIRLNPPNLAGLNTKLTFRRSDAGKSK